MVPAEPWQLEYFAAALARGLCIAEAGGCAGMLDCTQEQLEALARSDEVKLRVLACLQDRIGAVGDKEHERAMLRSEAWVGFVACRSRKAEREALAWLKYFAELGGVTGEQAARSPLSATATADLEQELRARLGRLRLVGGQQTPGV